MEQLVFCMVTCDYVIFLIADEQERVQKKTFVNWINSYLAKVSCFTMPHSSAYRLQKQDQFIPFLLNEDNTLATYKKNEHKILFSRLLTDIVIFFLTVYEARASTTYRRPDRGPEGWHTTSRFARSLVWGQIGRLLYPL